MAKIDFDFELNRKISSQLAFSIILILSLLLAWFSVSAGNKIVESAKNSPGFNIEKRIEKAKLDDGNLKQSRTNSK